MSDRPTSRVGASGQPSSCVDPARSRRRAAGPLLALLLAGAVLAGCGTTRPDPPPYPQVRARGEFQPAWTFGSVGKAPAGIVPAVVGDAVWAASGEGRVSILEAGNGRLRRRVELKTSVAAGVGTDGTLQALVSRTGDVIALDREGRERWRSALGAEVVAVPTVGDDLVVIRTVDGRIVALDRESGSVKWTWRQQPLPALTLRQNAGVAIDGDTVYAGLPAGRVIAIDARLGAPRWETVMSSSRGSTELERLIDIAGTPVVSGERVCAIAYQGRVACLRRDDGRIVWARDIQSGSGIAMRGDRIFTVDGGDLVRAFAIAGDDVWKQDAFVRRVMSVPVAIGGRLLLTDRFGSFHVLDATDGSPLARIEPDGSAFTSQPIVVGGPSAAAVPGTGAGDDAAFAFGQTVGGSLVAVPLK